MFKDKRIKILIVLAIVVLILGIVSSLESTSSKLVNYIKSVGFVDDEGLYIKVLSDIDLDEYYEQVEFGENASYDDLYFDIDNYQLLGTSMEYVNGIAYLFSPIYDYKDDSLIYDFEISNDNVQIMFEGEYNIITEKLTCELVDNQDVEVSSSDKEIMCSKVKLDMDDFVQEVRELFKDTNLLGQIRKG